MTATIGQTGNAKAEIASTTDLDAGPVQPMLELDGWEVEDTGITEPFNPTLINIRSQQMSLDTMIARIRQGEIDLAPDFQRSEVWKHAAKCRLIESLLIRIPLPAFYMDATDDEHWLVVDGLQRLSTLRDFVIEKRLKLSDLEFLDQFHGQDYDGLPRSFQRRILETQVTIYLIEKGTPPEVKFNIFKRINTGGLPLSAQEIRHALNQGPVTTFLKNLVATPEFQGALAGQLSDARMAARECVLRFSAFTITPYQDYSARDFDAFLSDAMARINKMTDEQRERLRDRLLRALRAATAILEENAFRKTAASGPRKPVNKALFEVWTVALDRQSDAAIQRLHAVKDSLKIRIAELEKDLEFMDAISQGTGDIAKVQKRFGGIFKLLEEAIR